MKTNYGVIFTLMLLLICGNLHTANAYYMDQNSTANTNIEKAKLVIAAHDRAANAGDLEAVMMNIADDVVVLGPAMPLVEGKEAFRTFYKGVLEVTWNASHYFNGAEQIGDAVVFHGIAKGTMTPPGGEPIRVANNFIILLKPDDKGDYKIWRAAFGVSGEER